MSERLDFICAGLDRRRFEIGARIRMVRLDEADVLEEELVAARSAELALFEEHRISGAVRLLLSVSTSTITGTLCGA